MDEEVAMDEYEPTDQEHNSGRHLLQDIWEKIILHLPREDQNNVALVCKLLHSFVSYVQDKNSISLVFGDRREFNTGVEIQDLEEFKKKLQGPQFVYSVSILEYRDSMKALYMLFEIRSVCQNLERLEVEVYVDFEANYKMIKVPTFPNLKRLKLVNCDNDMLIQFLTNSPQLKDLCVKLVGEDDECQFLSVLPTSIKRLEFAELPSNKSLENLILGIENGVVLEKLILHFVYFSLPDHLDVLRLRHCINRNCKLTEFGVLEYSKFLCDFEGISNNLKRLAISSYFHILPEDNARSFLRSCNTIEHVHINDRVERHSGCKNYMKAMRAFSELPNLTSVHLNIYPCDECLEIIADSVPSLRVIKFSTIIFDPPFRYTLRVTGFQSFVKKVQKTLKFIEVESGLFDPQDDLIKCVAEALDKPNTMTLKLPPGKVGNNVANLGGLTVIHGNPRFKF